MKPPTKRPKVIQPDPVDEPTDADPLPEPTVDADPLLEPVGEPTDADPLPEPTADADPLPEPVGEPTDSDPVTETPPTSPFAVVDEPVPVPEDTAPEDTIVVADNSDPLPTHDPDGIPYCD